MGQSIGGAVRAQGSETTARAGNRGREARRGVAARCLAAGSLLLLVACSTTPTAPPPIEYLDYHVGPPDQLSVTILPDPPVVETPTVRPDGMITVQLVGDITAGGRTTQEIAKDIESRISRYKRGAVVTVALSSAQSALVTVLGEVKGPNTFPLTRQMRVSEAIGTVGGVTLFADEDSVHVVRAGHTSEVIEVDMAAIRNGDQTTNVQIYGGDIVYVPPTYLAMFGYALNQLLFPFQPFLRLGTAAAGNAIVP